MKNNKLSFYTSPQVEMTEINAEQLLSGSPYDNGITDLERDDEIII